MKGLKYEDLKVRQHKEHKKSANKELYCNFGKLILNLKKLNENILLIKYPSKAPVPKLRRTVISDDFKAIINDLLDTKKINIQLQKELNDKEQDLFDLLMNVSGLKNYLNYKRIYKDVNYYMNKFEILRGSLNAGNNNMEIKNELMDIIDLLSNKIYNKIPVEEVKDFKDCVLYGFE